MVRSLSPFLPLFLPAPLPPSAPVAIALGPCVAPTRSQVRRVEQSNSFSRNQATVLELTKNIERLTGDCR